MSRVTLIQHINIQISNRRCQTRPDELLEVGVLRQGEGETDAGPQTLTVEGVCKVVVVEEGLHLGIGGGQPEFA